MESQRKLAQNLHDWMTKRMEFHPKGRHSGAKIPSPDDLKFLCRGQLTDIWGFVISHVHCTETVVKVKGNLALNRSKSSLTGYKVSYKSDKLFSHEREALLEQRRNLSAELTAATESIGELKKDLKSLREEIVLNEQTYQLKKSRIHDIECKTALLKAASQHSSNETAKLNEYLSLLKGKADHFQNLMKQGQEPVAMFTKDGRLFDGKDRVLEAVNTKDVRESCSLIGSFLGRVLNQGSFADGKNELERNQSDIWQRVSRVLNSYTSGQVLTALCDYTEDTVQSLDEATAAIDIRKDAEKLRFKYESGGQLSDMSRPPNILQTVRQLLEESQEATFARFIATEKSLNRTWKMQQNLFHLSDKSDKILTENHRGNPGALELAKTLYQTEMLLFTSNSLVRLLGEISNELKESVNQLSSKKQILFSKHQKIQDFRCIADSKQGLIRDLIKQNMDSRIKLQKDQLELLKYAERISGSQTADMNQMTKQLHDCVSKEIEVFTGLRLPHLLLTSLVTGDTVAVINLSINRMINNPDVSGCQTVQKLMKSFHFSGYKASECFLQYIASLMTELMDASLQLRSADEKKSLQDANSKQTLNINALCEDVMKSDERQIEQLIPPVQKRLNDATQCLTNCLQVKDIVLSWWEQPAQVCTPWITVDGLNLRQWKDRWTVAATQIRHLSLSA